MVAMENEELIKILMSLTAMKEIGCFFAHLFIYQSVNFSGVTYLHAYLNTIAIKTHLLFKSRTVFIYFHFKYEIQKIYI